mmetsp:Transcript_120167/g.383649  ORF Transcript_120167/g.383649 Transcript_120167/m.383649 type:complete len:231 (-) Transcript_120167:1040-1732(-)
MQAFGPLQGRQGAPMHGVLDLVGRPSAQGLLACQGHVHQSPERERVGTWERSTLCPKNLRSHPTRGTSQRPRPRCHQAAQSKVDQLCVGNPVAFSLDEYVRRFDVAVDDARRLGVNVHQCRSDVTNDLPAVASRLRDGQGLEELVQGSTVDVLQRQHDHPLRGADDCTVEQDDVRMPEMPEYSQLLRNRGQVTELYRAASLPYRQRYFQSHRRPMILSSHHKAESTFSDD